VLECLAFLFKFDLVLVLWLALFLLDFGSLLQISAGWRARSLEEAKYFQIPQLENWLKGKG
jgi:hypothetical protein